MATLKRSFLLGVVMNILFSQGCTYQPVPTISGTDTIQPTATFHLPTQPTPATLPTLPTPPTPSPIIINGASIRNPITPENAGQLSEIARFGRGSVTSGDISPTGQLMAIASSVGVYLYETAKLQEIALIETSYVSSVAFSVDGTLVAAGMGDGSVNLWRVDNLALLWNIIVAPSPVDNIAFSPDGTRLATATWWDNYIFVLDVQTGAMVYTLGGHTSHITSLAFLPDGSRLASGAADGIINLWRLDNGRLSHVLDWSTYNLGPVLNAFGNQIKGVAFSPDGKFLAAVSLDEKFRIWRVSDWYLFQTLDAEGATGVAFSPDGSALVVASLVHINVWDIPGGVIRKTLYYGSDRLSFSRNGIMLAASSFDNSVQLWDLTSNSFSPIADLVDFSSPANSIAFSADGAWLASSSSQLDNEITLWSLSKNNTNIHLAGHTYPVESIAFCQGGMTLISGAQDGIVRVWDVAKGIEAQTLQAENNILSVACSPSDSLLAAGGMGGTVFLWNYESGSRVGTLQSHSDNLRSLAFSPDGAILASAYSDGGILLHKVEDGDLVRTLNSPTFISSIVFSPDGQILAAGSWDGQVRLWDVETGGLLHSLEGHTEWVTSIAFSPEGNLLASGGNDATIRLWQLDGELAMMLTQPADVESVAFSPDGRLLASASRDGTIRIWGVTP
jgi:WD40 repeat protein